MTNRASTPLHCRVQQLHSDVLKLPTAFMQLPQCNGKARYVPSFAILLSAVLAMIDGLPSIDGCAVHGLGWKAGLGWMVCHVM